MALASLCHLDGVPQVLQANRCESKTTQGKLGAQSLPKCEEGEFKMPWARTVIVA